MRLKRPLVCKIADTRLLYLRDEETLGGGKDMKYVTFLKGINHAIEKYLEVCVNSTSFTS